MRECLNWSNGNYESDRSESQSLEFYIHTPVLCDVFTNRIWLIELVTDSRLDLLIYLVGY